MEDCGAAQLVSTVQMTRRRDMRAFSAGDIVWKIVSPLLRTPGVLTGWLLGKAKRVGSIQEGQRMDRALSRRIDKRWLLLVAVLLVATGVITRRMGRSMTMTNKDENTELTPSTAVAAAPNEDAPSEKTRERGKFAKESTMADIPVSDDNIGGGRFKKVPDFEKSVEEYNVLTRELDAALAAYRASSPVFANFLEVVTSRVVPLAIEGEKAGIWLADAKERGLHNYYENSDYDREKAQKAVINIAAAIYGDVYSQFQEAIEAGRLRLPNEQEKIYFMGCYRHFQLTAEALSGPFQDNYPYDEDTVEYYLFARDLGQMLTMAASPLGKMVYQVPAEIEEKQRAVDAFYERLLQQAKRLGNAVKLPDKYKEVYLKRLEAESQEIGQIAKLHAETKRTQRRILDEGLDAVIKDIERE